MFPEPDRLTAVASLSSSATPAEDCPGRSRYSVPAATDSVSPPLRSSALSSSVATVTVASVASSAMVTEAGSVPSTKSPVSAAVRVTVRPPSGAAMLELTVKAAPFPSVTLADPAAMPISGALLAATVTDTGGIVRAPSCP